MLKVMPQEMKIQFLNVSLLTTMMTIVVNQGGATVVAIFVLS